MEQGAQSHHKGVEFFVYNNKSHMLYTITE